MVNCPLTIAGESPKAIRGAYLDLLRPKEKFKIRGGVNNAQEHAVARATAFLPAQYAAVYNVLRELRTRLGPVVGPVLEVSYGIGPGFWWVVCEFSNARATHEVLGAQAAEGYALIHRTRHGLDLAKQLATALPVETANWVRDYTFLEMVQPQIAMSTFELSALPTNGSRRIHLDKLVDSGAEHIVLVDRATDEAWEAMSMAREHLLSKSTEDSPWCITAPCPHHLECPRAKGETCSFGQQLQRPKFLRRTKHAKSGEEIAPYTYLIVSRGARPAATTSTVGRTGGVGYDFAVRQHQKTQGKSVLRAVEGGDVEEYEAVPLASEDPLPRETVTPEMEDTLREESYAWPRLVNPPIKRSGHVVMDACTHEGTIQRYTFSKKQGKQIYHDARKSQWGDLFPHQVEGKSEVRTRGMKKLSRDQKEPVVVRDKEQEEVDALLKQLGMTMPVAVMDSEGPGGSTTQHSKNGNVTVRHSTRGYSTSARSHQSPRSHRSHPLGLGLQMSSRGFCTSQPRLSVQASGPPKLNVQSLQALHDSKTPITVLTAYDYPTSLLCSTSGVDMILVGDSLAQVALGYPSTVPLTLDEMAHHVRAVARGSGTSFLLVDLPFGYMEESVAAGAKAAVRLIKDGADGVKIEGGREIIPLVKRLSEHGVPVMAHIGLQPQRSGTTGYRAQARSASAGMDLIALAQEMEAAGAFGLLLEAIPHLVGSAIASRVSIPTIGIGAGPDTSGQVLVVTDMLGAYGFMDEKPKAAKFVREFGDVGGEMRRAVKGYCEAVRDRSYPQRPEETYTMSKEEAGQFRKLLEKE